MAKGTRARTDATAGGAIAPNTDPAFRPFFDYDYDYDYDGDGDDANLFQVRDRRSAEFKGY